MALSRSQRLWASDLADSAALAVLFGGNGREFLLAAGEEIAVALAQVPVLGIGEAPALSFGDEGAGVLEQAFDIRRPAVGVGVDHKGQLPQQVRAAQAMVAMIVGQVRGPTVVDDGPSVAGNDVDRLDGLAAAFGVEKLQGGVPEE